MIDVLQTMLQAADALKYAGAKREGVEQVLVARLAVAELITQLQEAVDHIVTLRETIEELASLGCTVAICGTTYDEAKARAILAKVQSRK
jgi:hypothetical protein